MNRERFSYYPEAYAWFLCMDLIYALTSFEPILYIGIAPGLALCVHFYVQFVRSARAMVEALR